jgi:hypothetical protein
LLLIFSSILLIQFILPFYWCDKSIYFPFPTHNFKNNRPSLLVTSSSSLTPFHLLYLPHLMSPPLSRSPHVTLTPSHLLSFPLRQSVFIRLRHLELRSFHPHRCNREISLQCGQRGVLVYPKRDPGPPRALSKWSFPRILR